MGTQFARKKVCRLDPSETTFFWSLFWGSKKSQSPRPYYYSGPPTPRRFLHGRVRNPHPCACTVHAPPGGRIVVYYPIDMQSAQFGRRQKRTPVCQKPPEAVVESHLRDRPSSKGGVRIEFFSKPVSARGIFPHLREFTPSRPRGCAAGGRGSCIPL
jgi:hypothetical protein